MRVAAYLHLLVDGYPPFSGGEHLGVEAPATGLGAALMVQADEISEQWVARVHDQLAELEAPA